jgi:gliding-associated putative ABC transporter substrate-binding component GldG
MKTKDININSSFGTKAILVVAILVLVNVVANMLYFRADLTKDQRYTLSEGTKKVVENLEDVVTIKAYMSDNLNAEFDNHRREIVNILEEYKELSNGNIELVIINPVDDEQKEEALKLQIPQVNLQEQAKDKLEVETAFLGLAFEMGTQSDVIPILAPNSPIEYPITKSIYKVANDVKQKIGVIKGHGETSKEQMPQLTQEAEVFYQFEDVTLSAANLNDYKALLWLNPTDTVNAMELKKVDDYMANGGGVFITYSNAMMSGGQQNQPVMFNDNASTFETWLNSKGVQFESSIAFDINGQNVQVSMFEQRRIFYFPVIQEFGEHITTNGLGVVTLQLSSPISYSGSGTFTPTLLTSEMSGRSDMPVFFNINKQWSEDEFTEQSIAVAGAIENGSEKMVVVSNAEFISNGQGQNMQQINPGNVSLVVNSLDWLSGNTALTALRGKGIQTIPIKNIEESKRNLYKYGNFLLPLILIVLYGFLRFQSKKRKRLKWSEMSIK